MPRTTDDDNDDASSGKFITTFSDSGVKKGQVRKKDRSGDPEITFLEGSEKGKYAFISAIGFGLIALIFIFFLNHDLVIVGMTLTTMGLLGAKAYFLAYPKVTPVSKTSTTVRSYFLVGILIMAWLIFISWSYGYLVEADEVTDDILIDWLKMVSLSILTLISVFFLVMTKARR